MKIRSRAFALLMLAALLLSAFPVSAQTQQSQIAAQRQVAETALPQKEEATGTLMFYLGGKAVHAGGPVSSLLELDIFTYRDMTVLVQPWHMTDVIKLQVKLPDTEEANWPNVFFVAMNASDTPCPISECLIYSITINCESGIEFGSGVEKEHFVTGQSTREELVAAYGEPDASVSDYSLYEEIFYYQPFNGVSFAFRRDVVRQISAYYSANVYGSLEDTLDFDIEAGPMEKDALILMSQYLDVTPYLSKDQDESGNEAEETAETNDSKDTTGILSKFDDCFVLDTQRIEFGAKIEDLPEPFRGDLNGLLMPVNRNYYIRVGRNNPEEFFVINSEGQRNSMSNTLCIKGVITESNLYCNWGVDNSGFHSFSCQGITQESSIDDVLSRFGAPKELVCSSGERTCFAWMHYESENGDTLRIRVDPIVNQVVEVQMSKYFENQHHY